VFLGRFLVRYRCVMGSVLRGDDAFVLAFNNIQKRIARWVVQGFNVCIVVGACAGRDRQVRGAGSYCAGA
jgi:hypothetical protein